MAKYLFMMTWVVVLQIPFIFLSRNSDGLSMVWIDKPDTVVNVQQGSNKTLTWHYKMGKNDTFLSSRLELYQKHISNILASRHRGESKYAKHEGTLSSFLCFGKNNVTLTVYKAECRDYNSTYCCDVLWKSRGAIQVTKKCTTIFVYALPRIIYHASKLSRKQGDSIKLQCNATGYPEPQIKWIRKHKHTQSVIERSSDTLLNITGKRSEGSYCCVVKNGFGKETKCTTIKVTEYKPVHTKIFSKRKSEGESNTLDIKCNANAYPPPTYFVLRIDGKMYNLSKGVKTLNLTTAKANITVSCIPWNKYGQGPMKMVNLPVYAPPRFTSKLRTRYNMTNSSINITCRATGIPTPNITWTKGGSKKIIGNKENYEVLYKKCVTKTLAYYCHARNVQGYIKSQKIKVLVMSQRSCSSAGKDLNQTKKGRLLFIITTIGILILVIPFLTMLIYWKRRMGFVSKDIKETDENPYQEPIDMVATSEVRLIDRSTLPDEGYASVFELTGNKDFRPQRNVFSIGVSNIPKSVDEEEPTYQKLTVNG